MVPTARPPLFLSFFVFLQRPAQSTTQRPAQSTIRPQPQSSQESLGVFLRLKGVTKFLPFLRWDGGRMVTEQQRGFVLAKPEFNVR